MLCLPNDDAVMRTPARDNVRPGVWARCQWKYVQSLQQTASARIRLADKAGEGTEWIQSQGMENPPQLLSSISPSQGFLFPCAVTRKVVLLVSMKANYFPYRPCTLEWMCVSKCEYSLYTLQVGQCRRLFSPWTKRDAARETDKTS